MKRYFLTGFIALFPLILTIYIVVRLVQIGTKPVFGFSEWILTTLGLSPKQHVITVLVLSEFFALILVVAFVFFLGFCSQKFLNKYFHRFADRLFSHIPLVGAFYRLSRDFAKVLFTNTEKTFQQTVLIRFPSEEALSLAFVTREVPEALKKSNVEIALFLPTAPHPFSGYLLLTSRQNTIPIDISVTDAFKYLISAGVLHPGEKPPSEFSNLDSKK